MPGPLAGIRIVEFAGLGPAPFCGMMLADHGAEVIRIDSPAASGLMVDPAAEFLNRSRQNLSIDLKDPRGTELARRLCAGADGLIEGFRPGVMERLGLGSDALLADNPRLVYGRMTGWGQDGPYASMAGHDINYIALSGALHAIGRADEPPVPPLNLVGDFGGGGMMLAFAMVSALLSAAKTGQGQVIDCAMSDGSALLMTLIYSLQARGQWRDEREANLFDGAAPFYDTYRTADGGFLAVGAIEPQFYRRFIEILGFADDAAFADQMDDRQWPALKARIAERIATKSRDEWMMLFAGQDACVAPVMALAEAPDHPHNGHRAAFVEVGGTRQPAPAPRYSVTETSAPRPFAVGQDIANDLLAAAGLAAAEIAALRDEGVIS